MDYSTGDIHLSPNRTTSKYHYKGIEISEK